MAHKSSKADDILSYLKSFHIGAENCVNSAVLERAFGVNGVELRNIVNKLRCDGQPVCSNVNGYFYAKNPDEISDTITQLLSRTKKIINAAQGLVLSHRVFSDETEDTYESR